MKLAVKVPFMHSGLSAVPLWEVNGDQALWCTLFERFGAGGRTAASLLSPDVPNMPIYHLIRTPKLIGARCTLNSCGDKAGRRCIKVWIPDGSDVISMKPRTAAHRRVSRMTSQ